MLYELVNETWAPIYLHNIDSLFVGKLHSGNDFIGFYANDATPYIILKGTAPQQQCISPTVVESQTTCRLTGEVLGLYFINTGQDWYNFEGLGGEAHVVSNSQWNAIYQQVRNCGGQVLPLKDFSNYE